MHYRLLIAFAWMWAASGGWVEAHETDQFLMPDPSEGEFADLGGYFNQIFVEAIHAGVAQANRSIDQQLRKKQPDPARLAQYRTPEYIARRVRRKLPTAMDLIEGLEWNLPSKKFKKKYPGQITIFKEHFNDDMHTGLHFPLDPRVLGRLWRAGTIKAYGTYMGTDKVGHFVDMGYLYYEKYRAGIRVGMTEDEAMAKAVRFGTDDPIASERSLLGFVTAGAYSNADLASNYTGCLLYRNLTEPVGLHGEVRPPTVFLNEQGRWEVSGFVDEDPDFFARYICDHFNEALNPSLFEKGMRTKVRKAVAKRRDHLIGNWYADEDGNPRSARYFESRALELATYYGKDYGHSGQFDELVHLGSTTPKPPDTLPSHRNQDQKAQPIAERETLRAVRVR